MRGPEDRPSWLRSQPLRNNTGLAWVSIFYQKAFTMRWTQGAQDVFKYHMASWITLSRPKDQGGLGIINTQIMNECLLTKWIWKIHQQPDEVWYKLLKAKYMRHKSFFKSHSRGAS